MKRIITLTTDFGDSDGCIGAVKGVIKSINPDADIVDISHQNPPQDILSAAFCLQTSYLYFPPNTIHVGIVDPGVGGKRRRVLVQTEKFSFIGPDNGLFSLILRGQNIRRQIELSNREYFLKTPSATFHGRDIFAPVAAYLSLGISPEQFGPRLEKLKSLDLPSPRVSSRKISGQIIHVDNFGNLITNITLKDFRMPPNPKIRISKTMISKISRTYSDVPAGKLLAYTGSAGYLEIGQNLGNAATLLKVKAGAKVEVLI
ncbi:MAG: SAM-dependent chlorinase/fluorinase [candidate division Zixibacteria bacterium]|nr:SAM-dependent chlorinase/fluorinase [candidate division Zixibacteria bacterium]